MIHLKVNLALVQQQIVVDCNIVVGDLHRANTVPNVALIVIALLGSYAFQDTTTYSMDPSILASANQQIFKCQRVLALEMTCACPEHAKEAWDFQETRSTFHLDLVHKLDFLFRY